MAEMKTIEFGKQNQNVAVLLHGGGLSWWNYREVAELLSEDFHVILPVLDGHGGAKFTSIEDNAAHIISYIDAHFGGQVSVLGGLSLGGQIALDMMSQRPDICRSALIESALAKPSSLMQALIGPAFAMSYGLIRQRWFARWQASYLGIPRALFEDYYRDTCAIRKDDLIAFTQANCGYALKPMATTARVKIVAGGREQRSILESAKMIHRAIPGSELEILPGLKHGDLSLNHWAQYARMVRELMGGQRCKQPG